MVCRVFQVCWPCRERYPKIRGDICTDILRRCLCKWLGPVSRSHSVAHCHIQGSLKIHMILKLHSEHNCHYWQVPAYLIDWKAVTKQNYWANPLVWQYFVWMDCSTAFEICEKTDMECRLGQAVEWDWGSCPCSRLDTRTHSHCRLGAGTGHSDRSRYCSPNTGHSLCLKLWRLSNISLKFTSENDYHCTKVCSCTTNFFQTHPVGSSGQDFWARPDLWIQLYTDICRIRQCQHKLRSEKCLLQLRYHPHPKVLVSK